MQIVDKAKALGAHAVDKLAAKREAVTETVSEIIDRGKDAAHHLVDRVSAVVKGTPTAVTSAEPAAPQVTKQRGHKKPRAERRRARRLARAHT